MGIANDMQMIEDRFHLLMGAAKLRLGANNLEMWENHCSASPWLVLDRLASIPDDREAVEWLLMGSRPHEIMCVVLGYDKLLHCRDDSVTDLDEKTTRFAETIAAAVGLSEAFSILAMYWFNIPIGYWRTVATTTTSDTRRVAG